MVCKQKRELLADYLERLQALSVETELLLDAVDKLCEVDWTDRWYRLEQARINCDIARLGLGTHARAHRC